MSMRQHGSGVRAAVTALLSGALALTGFLLIPPTTAAAATPCPAGVPVTGDLDGDGGADLLVSNGDRYRWIPSDGGPPSWLETGGLRTADLNGDVCADALAARGNDLRVYLGTPTGLDTAHPIDIRLPLSRQDPDEDPDYTLAGMRHHGVSQIVVAGGWDFDGTLYDTFVQVITLDATAHLAAAQSLDVPGLEEGWGGLCPVVADAGVIALGDPNARTGSKSGAGAVHVFSSDPADPARMVYRTVITQNSPGVPGTAETDDRFGESLSLRDGRLAIGVPGEAVGKVAGAGLVQPVRWHSDTGSYTAYRSISQSTKGVPGTSERNDGFGAVVVVTRGLTAAGSYDIAIGAPEERVGSRTRAGAVTVANFTRKLFRTYTQNTARIPGSAERGDGFGETLAAVRTGAGTDTLLIGAPGETTSGCAGVGYVIHSNGKKLSSATRWQQVANPSCADRGTAWGSDFGG